MCIAVLVQSVALLSMSCQRSHPFDWVRIAQLRFLRAFPGRSLEPGDNGHQPQQLQDEQQLQLQEQQAPQQLQEEQQLQETQMLQEKQQVLKRSKAKRKLQPPACPPPRHLRRIQPRGSVVTCIDPL